MKYYLIGHELPSDLVEKIPSVYVLSHKPASASEAGCFILNLDNQAVQDEWLVYLRQHSDLFMSPVFVLQSSLLSNYLADGAFPSDIVLRCEQYQQRSQVMQLDSSRLTDRLLAYLWVWPKRKVMVRMQPSLPALHDYPLLKLWLKDDESESSWLYSLERDQLIQGCKPLDRVRYCPDCHSGHLNYIDCCPECGSIDIAPESALHCFACGHVAGQDAFLRQGALSCPNCLSQLRHIGVDYDRPIENYRCHDCHAFFVDGLVKARCFEHGHEHSPDLLIVKPIRHFELGEQADAYVRTGGVRHSIPEWIGDHVTLPHFQWLILWQNRLAVRHSSTHLIVAMHFPSFTQAIMTLGEIKVMSLMNDLFIRLQSVVRTTDVCCHYRQDTLLFFLPSTPSQHAHFVTEKLAALSEKMVHESMKMQFLVKELPDPTLTDSADLFLHALISECLL